MVRSAYLGDDDETAPAPPEGSRMTEPLLAVENLDVRYGPPRRCSTCPSRLLPDP
jgi:hypothetical protein